MEGGFFMAKLPLPLELTSFLYHPDGKPPTAEELDDAVAYTRLHLRDYEFRRESLGRIIEYSVRRDNIEIGVLGIDYSRPHSYIMDFTIASRMNIKSGITDDEKQLKREFDEICVRVVQRAKKLKMDRLRKQARLIDNPASEPPHAAGSNGAELEKISKEDKFNRLRKVFPDPKKVQTKSIEFMVAIWEEWEKSPNLSIKELFTKRFNLGDTVNIKQFQRHAERLLETGLFKVSTN